MAPDPAATIHELRAQWDRLDRWLHGLGDALVLSVDRPSVLDGWTVGELLSHLGRNWVAVTRCGPVPAGTVPLTLAEYLGTYPERATEIADAARVLDRELAPDRLAGIERLATTGLARLDELESLRVVQAPRGPVALGDMVLTRTLELVVHADDLARSFPGASTDPVHPAALDAVSDALLQIVVTRGGWSLEVDDARLWLRLACGRTPYDVDLLARALRPVHVSDAVPDLGRILPVL
ncbi:maleylpyruvate isomerase N-terminal domain-containing protein [Cellulosimicrobium arenosum]|uniref:Maleylpyruvate isomerase N-terminal domain-containing protein n=1 Tax=Cellulosimicrobium arenosum TaxID=2708133 RepID=A0A927G8Y5_9MICO|nr:maleylpyruvate isomerase N-terminal domain-containing protein [Cellulosimicrobium arenosum]MBD8079136.1 maleylpyruvate isomerase N-terminal domain-containing protein [Cellulosimicrobium arenosum]